jgi:NAD(P)-dependent dehydrogenase (short-subunit alcohol dehydrogenase family)
MNHYLESLFSLQGKIAVVTGGGRGLGKGMAVGLAGAGAEVALVSRTEKELKETVAEIRAKGGKADAYPADISKLNQIPDLVQAIHKKKGRIDILVNNAGFIIRKMALDYSPEDWERQLDVNLKAAFFMAQAVAKFMKEQDGGKIINTLSLTSFIGLQNAPGYGISRGGLLSMTRTLAMEWAKYHIHVNAVAPGYFKTNQTAPLFADEKRVEWMLSRIPLARAGVPDDLAGVAIFLASPASDYMTGQAIVVDGGWLAG